MAIGFVILLLESSFIELSKAEGAHEVFGVEFPEHGGYAASGDGFVTPGA